MPEKFYIAAKAWVTQKGRTLVLRDQNGEWDLPGGRMDASEFGQVRFLEVLRRELMEEIGLPMTSAKLVGVSQWSRDARSGEVGPVLIFVVHFGVTAPQGFVPTLSGEHSESRWVEKPNELLPLGLVPELLTQGGSAT